MEIVKEIVVAMINNGYIPNAKNIDENIENVNKAIDKIAKQIHYSHIHKSEYDGDWIFLISFIFDSIYLSQQYL